MFDKLIDLIISVWNDFKPIIFILQYKEGVMLRAGKFNRILQPGWHFRIPFVDDYLVENVKLDTMQITEVNITTLDGKTVTIGCEFELYIVDIYAALIDTNDWRSNLHDMCQGILSENLEDLNWEEIKKKTTKNSISKKIEAKASEMGIATSNFNFTNKAMSSVYKLFNNPMTNGGQQQ